ncbi:MAG: hypothetical protein JGK01_19865 [Microcoleus sp. PH2017_03_ELD_O_A]|nr:MULTISPECIES: hypothetical protein [unclassified Microcoleus]MCC3443938.1 hypothetical protein [Microcoleus sp. PH2017_03_ELD_O_A]MCC3504133.1 hypothetical protein [Microcoleus sp. PH2017_19_SFW_U_A]MCC3508531.1 hypothetical protein [Microcoleus sp. PH2017_17_BER_D_A]MCC3522306.1 hypothetical protein [Microcoleus sp. PH2017_20_SFW_D_A]MCC3553255.1 hypothetical protein [Microcoleus sp. PH2017_35_SFW_U_B]
MQLSTEGGHGGAPPLPTVNCQLSTVNCQLSTVNCPWLRGQIPASLAESR